MKTIVFTALIEKDPDKKIMLIKTLVNYNDKIGLRVAKDKVDKLAAGIHVEYEVDESQLVSFINDLKKLKLEFEIK